MFMVHIVLKVDEPGDAVLFGKTIEEIRGSSLYKDLADTYEEAGVFKLELIEGSNNLPAYLEV